MEPQEQETQATQKPSKGYGKRPVWQWVLIYVVVAAVVYGLIYYLFSNNGNDAGGNGGFSY